MRTYCPVCKRPRKLTVHHLFPTTDHKWKGRQECELCSDCHVELHHRFDNRTLRNKYNSIEKIRSILSNQPEEAVLG